MDIFKFPPVKGKVHMVNITGPKPRSSTWHSYLCCNNMVISLCVVVICENASWAEQPGEATASSNEIGEWALDS